MREREMLDALREWFTANKQRLTAAQIDGRTKRAELEDEMLTPALYKAAVELKSEKVLASFTVWASGEVSVIVMDNDTGSEFVVDDRRLQQAGDLHVLLDYYCLQIASGGPFVKYMGERT